MRDPGPFVSPARTTDRPGPDGPALAALLAMVLAACGGGTSTPGPQPETDCLRDVDCDDQVECTEDVCGLSLNGIRQCEHTPRSDRCQAGVECLVDSVLGSGCIEKVALWCAGREDGDPCVPQDACAEGSPTCQGGRCTYDRKECLPTACLDSQGCDAATGQCQFGPKPDGTACDYDGLACSQDECRDGQCRVIADGCECTATRACEASPDRCLESPRCVDGTCVYDPVTCPADEDCRGFTCQSPGGECVPHPIRNGESCDDGLACTGPDTCDQGTCGGGPIACAPGPCRTASCVEPVGCVTGDFNDGTECDNGNACDGPDECTDGACLSVGPGVECDDSNRCTLDSCRPSDGGCDHVLQMDCCTNGILEAGERCDPGPLGSPLCSIDCQFATADVSPKGAFPAVAWWKEGRSGLLAMQEENDVGMPILTVRTVSATGVIGEAIEVPGVTSDLDDWYRPALAVLPGGRFLLAFYDPPALGLRVVAADGTVVGTNAIPDGVTAGADGPGDAVKVGVLGNSFLVAWGVKHVTGSSLYHEVRATWVNLVNDTPLPALEKVIAGNPAASESDRLGSVCMGGDGGLLTISTRVPGVTRNNVSFFGSDAIVQPVHTLGEFTQSLQAPPLCGATADGFLAVMTTLVSAGDRTGSECAAVLLDASGAPLGPPTTLVQTLKNPGMPYEIIVPGYGAVVPWGEARAFVASWLRGEAGDAGSGLFLKVHPMTEAGALAGDPLPVEGATDGFVMTLDVTTGPDGAILLAWNHQESVGSEFQPGTVRARFLAPP